MKPDIEKTRAQQLHFYFAERSLSLCGLCWARPVSYTHLDVYKRQDKWRRLVKIHVSWYGSDGEYKRSGCRWRMGFHRRRDREAQCSSGYFRPRNRKCQSRISGCGDVRLTGIISARTSSGVSFIF